MCVCLCLCGCVQGVSVPSRESNLSELGYPNWAAIFDGVLRKIGDEAQYGNGIGLGGGSDAADTSDAQLHAANGHSGNGHGALDHARNAALVNAQSVQHLLQSTVGGHLSAFKSFLGGYLRATPSPSQQPSSPNPMSISAPLPPLSQQPLVQALSSFLAASLLPHQLAQVAAHLAAQTHFMLGRALRGAAFPVETNVVGREGGGRCGIRICPDAFQARMLVFRTFMRASQQRHRAAAAAAGQQAHAPSPPSPIFYLSPSFAHALGLPHSLPRLCLELGVGAEAFRIMPIAPVLDEAVLALHPSPSPSSSGTASPSGSPQPNPFLVHEMHAPSLEAELGADAAALRMGSTSSAPCALFLTQGNAHGIDQPYEFDNVAMLAGVAARYGLAVHVEGTGLFAKSAEAQAGGSVPPSSSASATGSGAQCSTLFQSADSILLTPGAWVGLPAGPALVAFRDPAFLAPRSAGAAAAAAGAAGVWAALDQSASCISSWGGGAPSGDDFARLWGLWFNLAQVHPPAMGELLGSLAARQAAKVAAVRRLLDAQVCPVFVAPAGEGDQERRAYAAVLGGAPAPVPVPSHPHLFFSLALPAGLSPADFHLADRSALNAYVARRMHARLAHKQGEWASLQRVYGLSVRPAVHFDLAGFAFAPAAVSIWTSEAQVAEEVAAVGRVLEALAAEVAALETQARLRAEFAALVAAEAPDFIYVPPCDLQPSAGPDGVVVGLGGVRFLPAQIPEQHLEEVGRLLNESLAHCQPAMHFSASGPDALETASQLEGLVSMYRAGRTRARPAGLAVDVDGGAGATHGAASLPAEGGVCTVLEASEVVLHKPLRAVLGELKGAAARLVYPAHIVDDLSAALCAGIRAAEERLTEKSADAYRPTAVLRWLPVVGPVLNWVAPQPLQEGGHSFNMKRKELSNISYSYSNSGVSAAGSGLATPSSTASRKGSLAGAGMSINPAAAASQSHSGTPVATPSPLSINHAAQAHAQAQAQAQAHSRTSSLSHSQSSTPTSASTNGSAPDSNATTPPVIPPSPLQTAPRQVAQGAQSTVAAAATGRPPLPPATPQQAQPQHAQQQQQPQQHPQQQSQQQHAVPEALPPVQVTLDEADRPFVEVLNSAPRTLQADQLELLTRGETFLAYFPNEPEEGAETAAAGAGAGAMPPSTSVTKLLLFLEPSYLPTEDEAQELCVSSGVPVSLLCWCEPDARPRYVKLDQAVAVEQVSALHLGASDLFPRQSVRAHCLSLVTPHVALHLEADSAAKRKDWFVALYTLVSQAPAIAPSANAHARMMQQQQQQQQQLQPYSHQPQSSSSPASATSLSSIASSESEAERNLVSARALLEAGAPFVVYVLDKNDAELTTRHEVLLWLRPAVHGGPSPSPHSLCWCRRGGAKDFSPARSLPLNKTVQICLGKQVGSNYCCTRLAHRNRTRPRSSALARFFAVC